MGNTLSRNSIARDLAFLKTALVLALAVSGTSIAPGPDSSRTLLQSQNRNTRKIVTFDTSLTTESSKKLAET